MISFAGGIYGLSRLTSFGLLGLTNFVGKLSYLIFGSALLLIPDLYDDRNKFWKGEPIYEFYLSIGDVRLRSDASSGGIW